ncbi:hypothetical protein Syun_018981 [Stephania yunnanensis]|uniref:Pentatricopeptide repeat-containing protein n=1 Tax=Stephania yunnanensis TaxID=152371 RepID=A0AAP0IT90_9MAGN
MFARGGSQGEASESFEDSLRNEEREEDHVGGRTRGGSNRGIQATRGSRGSQGRRGSRGGHGTRPTTNEEEQEEDIHQGLSVNPMKLPVNQRRRFSSSSSSPSTSLPWISPLHYIKPVTPELDPPPETSTVQRRPKFITHQSALTMINAERDPQRALQIFNMVSEQRGFSHNHATYSVILHKLAQSKKFKAVDALLRQMSFETCKFHEGVFLNLMTQFAKSSHHERTLEMFFLIQPIVREKPSLKAVSTCLNLVVESGRLDLARKLLVESKRMLDLKPNTCIFNILVKHHMRNGDVDLAFEVVKEMRKCEGSYPNLITYSTLMGGLCKGGRLKDALQLFEEMVSKDQILPDVLTYNVLINGFCQAGKVDRAKR